MKKPLEIAISDLIANIKKYFPEEIQEDSTYTVCRLSMKIIALEEGYPWKE